MNHSALSSFCSSISQKASLFPKLLGFIYKIFLEVRFFSLTNWSHLSRKEYFLKLMRKELYFEKGAHNRLYISNPNKWIKKLSSGFAKSRFRDSCS